VAEFDKSASTYTAPRGGRRRNELPSQKRFLRQLALCGLDNSIFESSEPAWASSVGYSVRQFRRLCQTIVGEPAASFIKRMKLERAAGLLMGTERTISAIALETGWGSVASFSKAFSAYFRCSPARFRKLNKGKDCNLPGFALRTSSYATTPRCIHLVVDRGHEEVYMYDGMVLLGRIDADGEIDWLPRHPLRRPSPELISPSVSATSP